MRFLCHLRISTLIITIGALFIFVFLFQLLLEFNYIKEDSTSEKTGPINHVLMNSKMNEVKHPVILWWTPFTGEGYVLKTCRDKKCFFTEDRTFQSHPLIKAMMFYGSKFDVMDLPLPRNGSRIHWALLHEESPKNTPVLSHAAALRLFNFTSTFSRHSHSPLTLQYLRDADILRDMKYFVPTETKNRLLQELAPVAYIQSDCSTPLERDAYVTELMKYIPVDSYGSCIQNKKLPPSLANPLESMDSDEFFHFVARYKFTLAFENAVCEDYITEKLWRPLIVGSVPVYMGSPSVKDWLPNNSSAIIAADFKSPQDLAEYLLSINKDDNMYNSFLQHKLSSHDRKITNTRLLSALQSRTWGVDNDLSKINMVEYFECFVCQRVNNEHTFPSVANISHYDCPRPLSPLTGLENPENWWVDQWHTGNCEAEVLKYFVDTRRNTYSSDEFYEEVKRLLFEGKC
ncbi:alpha-(1,3)-fucosyltransferase 10 [Anabrus simplex]|uniref:alpha-(1,3)-fucosyltransferase 10 n=1 Tax=Anabrus simplex TaxID=316456 RepID=UPI0035A27297